MDGSRLLPLAQSFALPFYQEATQTGPVRAYHNEQHIQNMLGALHMRGIHDPWLELAVWGHDLIYDPRANDNEQRSAEVFDDWLAQQGAADNLRAEVKALILATQHHLPQTRRQALLLDADLSILGAEPAVFVAYDQAIRQEYRHVPLLVYKPARRKVLQRFLSRPQLYTTPEFADLEKPARRNLSAAIAGAS